MDADESVTDDTARQTHNRADAGRRRSAYRMSGQASEKNNAIDLATVPSNVQSLHMTFRQTVNAHHHGDLYKWHVCAPGISRC